VRNIRTATCAALVALLVAGVVPARGAVVTTQKNAFASWLVRTEDKHRFKWFFAAGETEVSHGGKAQPTFAAFGKGTCIKKRKRTFVDISCTARSQSGAEGPSTFDMDALATEARLRIGKRTARIVGGELNDDGLYTASLACAMGTGGGIARLGDASGHMFGRRLRSRHWYDYSLMMSGALIDACPGARDLFSDLEAGRRIELSFVRG
jgi:hypothetical protein